MNIFQRFFSKLLSIFVKPKIKEPKEIVCKICNKTFSWSDMFKCNYCHNYYCKNHRLPENHNCSGNPPSPPKTAG